MKGRGKKMKYARARRSERPAVISDRGEEKSAPRGGHSASERRSETAAGKTTEKDLCKKAKIDDRRSRAGAGGGAVLPEKRNQNRLR